MRKHLEASLRKSMWEWRCRTYNFIKTTYDISLNSHIYMLPTGFSPQWPMDWPMWCPTGQRESRSVLAANQR